MKKVYPSIVFHSSCYIFLGFCFSLGCSDPSRVSACFREKTLSV
jgi:hypothetical protein